MSSNREFTQLAADLSEAIKLLSPFVESSDKHALVANLLEGGSNPLSFSSTDNVTVDARIQDIIMMLFDLVDGGITVSELQTRFKEFIKGGGSSERPQNPPPPPPAEIANKIRKFIRITIPGSGNLNELEDLSSVASIPDSNILKNDTFCYLNDLTNYKKNQNVTGMTLKSGGIQAEKLYAIELLNPRLGLPGKDTRGVSIFTSLIPAVEMSRCTPYVNVSIKTTSSIQAPPVYQGLSLMSFLNGRGEVSPARGSDTFLSFDSLGAPFDAGMEIFTSPQMLVPESNSKVFSEMGRGSTNQTTNPATGEVTRGVNNIQVVSDRFRPFMSLKNISFSVVPSGGWMSYKSGKIELVLHDRSRLGDIAAFIRPGLYNKTDLDIEYGWSHPTGRNAERNAIGTFLNSQRIREQYKVVNSSFNFDDSGQVNISLSIAMKGNGDIVSTDVSLCGSSDSAKEIHKILEEIQELIAQSNEKDSKRFSKIFGDVIMNAVGSDSAALSIDEEKLKELNKKIETIKRSKSKIDGELADKLDQLFDPTNGKLSSYKESASAAIATQLNNLKSGIEIFPFHNNQIGKASNATYTLFEKEGDLKKQTVNNPISLGRVLMAFVGVPLEKSKNYKEIHFLFHTFNDKCTFMRDLCIAKFPIPVDRLDTELKELMKKNTKVSISKFVEMLNSRFIGNMAAHAYGLNFIYETDDEGNPKKKSSTNQGKEEDQSTKEARQYNLQDKVIKIAGINDGVFKLPRLAVYPECIADKKTGESILRMHVIDESCVSFSTLAELLRASNDVDITSFGFLNNPEYKLLNQAPELEAGEIQKNRKEILDRLKSDGVISNLIQTVSTPDKPKAKPEVNVQFDLDPSALLKNKSLSLTKKYVARGIPLITFGKENSTIKSIGLQSLADPALATVNMINMDKVDSSTPDLTVQRGVPMQIAPTECSIEMLGCPNLAYMQQFFIDFGTGTSADNIYNVIGIEHKIEPGSFTTSVKLVFTDAYGKYTSQIQKVKTAASIIYGLTDTAPKKSDNNASGTGGTSNKPKPPPDFFDVCKLSNPAIITDIAAVSEHPGGPTALFRIDDDKAKIVEVRFWNPHNNPSDNTYAKFLEEIKNSETGHVLFSAPLNKLNSRKNITVTAAMINPNTGRTIPKNSFESFKDFGRINSDGTITLNFKKVIDKKIELQYIKK